MVSLESACCPGMPVNVHITMGIKKYIKLMEYNKFTATVIVVSRSMRVVDDA